jgi:AmiR/NasT family two-component response regulator
MRAAELIPNFVGQHALVLHRPHPVVDAIARQLAQLGMECSQAWPVIAPERQDFDHLFYDADMGHDGQFPWSRGAAPVPTIALIGSEAPGRIAWAIQNGADAHLLKPVGSAGIYSALVIATTAFRQRVALEGDLAALRRQLDRRQALAEATAMVMQRECCDADRAYALLRQQAMEQRLTIEELAVRLLQERGGPNERRSRA